ncbi:MAG TPA: hypothetical protein VJC10_04285 [Patescibacteria group bacterium]|nr:hypothetical protein [Patescibacteria group bacterium]
MSKESIQDTTRTTDISRERALSEAAKERRHLNKYHRVKGATEKDFNYSAYERWVVQVYVQTGQDLRFLTHPTSPYSEFSNHLDRIPTAEELVVDVNNEEVKESTGSSQTGSFWEFARHLEGEIPPEPHVIFPKPESKQDSDLKNGSFKEFQDHM